jgi:Contractile injection system tube protein
MIIPNVTRGRFTVASTGMSRNVMFNPSEITDEKQINWGQLDIPGASHPVFQFGTGGERLIQFELYLDGDRGRFGRLDTQEDISVQSEINFYRSLVYPVRYNSDDFAAVYPHMLLFSFGRYVDLLPCIMKGNPVVRIFHWTPKLEPVRATVTIMLSEVTTKSQVANDIYPTLEVGNPVVTIPTTVITSNLGSGKGGKPLRLATTFIEGKRDSRTVLDEIVITGNRPRTELGPVALYTPPSAERAIKMPRSLNGRRL